ncbi:MAG TPA: plastocyanin/azurin family copper-binding protein [Nitrososphaera sp.]|nr:plastocyanin/azurin family copper-binding protein [Nitrososphaera sp.]
MVNHAGGISLIAFIVAVGVSMGYYQYMYVPAVNAKPILPDNVLHPPQTTDIKITKGSSSQSNPKFFDPQETRAPYGVANHVIWHNNDEVAHSVTSDDDYKDQINGSFNSIDSIGLVPPGGTFEFTFTKEGTYNYHCEPHPWMHGTIDVTESFA